MARILVIDDDESIRIGIRTALTVDGHIVDEAEDGETGLDHYHENSADIVIVDLMLPDKQGLDIIQEIRTDHPEAKILALSGRPEILKKAVGLGADQAFEKPIRMLDLLETIKGMLR